MKYIYIMYFQNGKHLWTYHGMVDDPMCASFKAFLLCHQMPLSIPAVGVQQELFQAQPSFWTIENGDVYWCCLMFPINVGRTNIYIYIYIHMLQLYLFVFICGHEDSPDSFQGLWEMVIFADLPENGKEWLMLCAKFQLWLCRCISPLPMEGPQTTGMMWLKNMMQCYMWLRRSRSRRVWPQIVLDDSTTFKSYNYWFCPLCQPPQEFHQCEALKILWPTLNKEFKQWNTRQNSWNGLNVVQQIVWKQLEFSGSKNLVLVTIEVNRSRWNRECYAPSRVGVRRI